MDYNGNGEPDAGEPSAVTDSNGDYTITGVNPGDWTVLEELQGQYVCTAPASCQQDLSVTSNGSTGGADFGDAVPGATIEGSVFNDLNADGAPRAFDPVSGDPIDPGLGGREVWLETYIYANDETGRRLRSRRRSDATTEPIYQWFAGLGATSAG